MRDVAVLAYDVATSFDLAALRPQAEQWGKIHERSPLVVELSVGTFVVVFDYGSVVFFGFTPDGAREQLERLKGFASRANRREYTDTFTLHIGGRHVPTTTEQMTVDTFLVDTVKLVAVVLSRSVSLEYYEDLIDHNLAKLEASVNVLSREGRFVFKRRELVKEVGFALAIQHELAYNLQILDEPDVLWSHGQDMQKWYEHLATQFSIAARAQVVERKLSIIARSSEFIIERLQERTANLLEWAIIGLFVIDLWLIIVLR